MKKRNIVYLIISLLIMIGYSYNSYAISIVPNADLLRATMNVLFFMPIINFIVGILLCITLKFNWFIFTGNCLAYGIVFLLGALNLSVRV